VLHEGDIMDRRAFLKSAVGAGALAATGGLATPAISARAAARALRHAGGDLGTLPSWRQRAVDAVQGGATLSCVA
jgi:hypothetical protein